MRVICHREGFLAACQLTSAALPARDVKPILRNLKAIAADGRCTLMATDMEVGIRLDVQGLTIQEPGEAILPAAKLVSILREARDAELSIEADPSACIIRGESLEFEMPSEDPVQFPDLPTFAEDKYHEISAGSLREMIRRTVFAAADETARYSMTGVLWELDEESAKLVATDGRRLALAQGLAVAHGGHSTKGQAPVVPTKAMGLLERNLADDEEEPVKICLRPNEVLFRTGRAVIYSRLVEGRFPDYRQVIPKKQNVRVELQAEPFQAAVRQAAIMTDDDSKRVTFRFSKKKLTLQAQGANSGRSKVELPIDYDSKPLDINFNPAYVVDMLKNLPPDAELTLDLIDGASPALFRSGGGYSYLVMPLT
ncbi:MAG TPA: DNA polymerase III subunit beta [Gemmataceae bacterium]|jgi:DNA polymerase-3 subunit beta|nr:DNA polymerase III subunit beta [Gemmataceae bacterium]